jgi:hypothetical protein
MNTWDRFGFVELIGGKRDPSRLLHKDSESKGI